MEEYVVYVLYSEKHDRLYIGFTNHLILRFHFHNQFSPKGFTKNYRPWKVIHVEFFDLKSLAMKREKELKQGKGREWIRTKVLTSVKS